MNRIVRWIAVVGVGVTSLVLGGVCPGQAADGILQESARHKRPSASEIFRLLDADHDGVVTRAEFVDRPLVDDKAKVGALFMLIDADGDGKLTVSELKAARQRMLDGRVAAKSR